jgi:hypothetical protein
MKPLRHEFFTGAQFDRFLQAPIGEDSNGMLLTVLSALARLDVDPWEEAAALSRLPGLAATRKLALLLATLPGRSGIAADWGAIASRLISLLPSRVQPAAPAPAGVPAVGAAARPPVLRSLLVYLAIMLLMFAGEWLVSHAHPNAAQAGAVAAPAGSAAPPSAPPTRP